VSGSEGAGLFGRECSGSVIGHDYGDRAGRCTWCGKKVNSAVPAPSGPGPVPPTRLGEAYRYFYDPDYGV
jgi:hypothetical protein